jgi:Protein of unknown function (DUF2934)
MKGLQASNQDKFRNEGRTQVELAAEIRRRAYGLYEERGRADGQHRETGRKRKQRSCSKTGSQ